MGYLSLNLLYNKFTLIFQSFSSFARIFYNLLVVFLVYSPTVASRLGHFLTLSRSTVIHLPIGSHHVTKIVFLINYDSIVPYVSFLRSGINLEGNLKEFSFQFSILHNHARPKDFIGSQTMFNTWHSSFFFLLSPGVDSPQIISNHSGLKPIAFSSSSAKPNLKFITARFVSGILRFLNWVDKPTRDRIFASHINPTCSPSG